MMLLGTVILVRHRERSQNTGIKLHKSRHAFYLKDTVSAGHLNPFKPTIYTARFNTNNTAFCPHCIHVFGMILTIIRALCSQ